VSKLSEWLSKYYNRVLKRKAREWLLGGRGQSVILGDVSVAAWLDRQPEEVRLAVQTELLPRLLRALADKLP